MDNNLADPNSQNTTEETPSLMPDFSSYNYQHKHRMAESSDNRVDFNKSEPIPEQYNSKRKLMVRIKLLSLFLFLAVIGGVLFFRTKIYDYFYYNYFYSENYTDLVTLNSENPTIEGLLEKNDRVYALYKDRSKSREEVITELKNRGKLLKEAFKIYTYEQLTPVIEDPKILALSKNSYYSPYIEHVVSKKGVMDFTKFGLASSDAILGDQIAKPDDINTAKSNKFVLYNKDTGEFYNLYSPTLNTDEVKRFSGFIVLSEGIILDDEMLISDIYKINPNETGVLGLSLPSRNINSTTIIVLNTSKVNRKFNKGMDNKDKINEVVNSTVNKYLNLYSQGTYRISNMTYVVNADPDEYCNLTLPKKASYTLSKISDLNNLKDTDSITLIDVCDNNIGSGFATKAGKLDVINPNGSNMQSYVFTISGTRVSTDNDLAAKVYIQKLFRSMGVLGSSSIENDSCLTDLGLKSCGLEKPDMYDIMSAGTNLTASKRQYLNLLDKDQIVETSVGGDFTLYPLDVALYDVSKALVVPVIKSPFTKTDIEDKLYYYIENRADDGMQVRLASKRMPMFDDINSVLVASNLHNGSEFYDSVNKIRIKVAENNKLKLSLERTSADDLLKPNIKLDIQGKNIGNMLTGVIEIRSNAKDNVKIDQHSIVFNNQSRDCSNLTLCTLKVDTQNLFDNKVYEIVSKASDPSNNKETKNLSFTVDNAAGLVSSLNKYKVTYYSRLNLLGERKTRLIDTVGIDLNSVSQLGFDKAKFAVVFEGLTNKTGYQNITVNSNNPVRVWVNDKIVINEIGSNKVNEFKKTILLDKKINNIKIEYLSDGSNLPPILSLKYSDASENEYQDQLIKDKEDEKPVEPIKTPVDNLTPTTNITPTPLPSNIFIPTIFTTPVPSITVNPTIGLTPTPVATPTPTKPVTPMVLIDPKLLSPINNSTLTGSNAVFSWSFGTMVDEYKLVINKSSTGFGTSDIFSYTTTTASTTTAINLPVDGTTIYVRLYFRRGTAWNYYDYSFKTYTSPNTPKATAAQLESPNSGTLLQSSSITFSWTGGELISSYSFKVGKSAGSSEYLSKADIPGTQTSITVSNIPQDGTSVYIDIISKFTDGTNDKDFKYSFPTKNQYATQTEVIVKARGESTDDFPPKLTLKIAGNTYESKNIAKSDTFSEYTYKANYTLGSTFEVQLDFANDKSDPITPNVENEAIDRNIYIQWVKVNGVLYPLNETNSNIVYDRANRLNNRTYLGYPSFGTSNDCIGLLHYNDNLGIEKRKFLGEIYWRGSIRIKKDICKIGIAVDF